MFMNVLALGFAVLAQAADTAGHDMQGLEQIQHMQGVEHNQDLVPLVEKFGPIINEVASVAFCVLPKLVPGAKEISCDNTNIVDALCDQKAKVTYLFKKELKECTKNKSEHSASIRAIGGVAGSLILNGFCGYSSGSGHPFPGHRGPYRGPPRRAHRRPRD